MDFYSNAPYRNNNTYVYFFTRICNSADIPNIILQNKEKKEKRKKKKITVQPHAVCPGKI